MRSVAADCPVPHRAGNPSFSRNAMSWRNIPRKREAYRLVRMQDRSFKQKALLAEMQARIKALKDQEHH